MAAHLKVALKVPLVLTLDDLQLWLMDGALDQLERLSEAASAGLDDVLRRLEDAAAYLPLPPALRE